MISLIQIDDFSKDILAVRNEVVKGDFFTEIGPDGAEYTGISKHKVPQWHDLISTYLGRQVEVKMSFFRLNLKGDLPHSWVHSDDICAKNASVLYMNLPSQCKGGTAFWRHRALNVDRLQSKEELESLGINGDWYHGMMSREWKDITYWDQTDFVGMKLNRFVTYPTCRFHSRYPFEGFGSGPEDGRLVWVCFYD